VQLKCRSLAATSSIVLLCFERNTRDCRCIQQLCHWLRADCRIRAKSRVIRWQHCWHLTSLEFHPTSRNSSQTFQTPPTSGPDLYFIIRNRNPTFAALICFSILCYCVFLLLLFPVCWFSIFYNVVFVFFYFLLVAGFPTFSHAFLYFFLRLLTSLALYIS
jgi:hypothetical protein